MKLSVIVPVYNVEEYLAQCLESLIYQSYRDLEIIIVDDGSPDNSAEVYEKYAKADPRIKIIRRKNGGPSAARNTGLDAATGEYIHFIDGDDYLDRHYYEKMIAAARDTGADIAAGGVVSQNEARFSISHRNSCILVNLAEKFKATDAIDVCTAWRYVFRRNFITKNSLRFKEGHTYLEDVIFTPEAMMLAKRVVTVPDTYYYYVNNPNSILNKKYPPNFKKDLEYATNHRDCFIRKHRLEHLREAAPETTVYKFLCFKLLKKISSKYGDWHKYYLLGLRVLKIYSRVRSVH